MKEPARIYSEADKITINKRLDDAIRTHAQSSLELAFSVFLAEESGSYKLTHATIHSFMKEKYDIEKSRVYQLIEAAKTVLETEAVFHNCGKLESILTPDNYPKLTCGITNEGQARAIKKVSPENRPKVLSTVVESGETVTAKAITVAAATIAGNEKHKPKIKPKANEQLLPHVQEAFDHRYEFDAIISDIDMAIEKCRVLAKKKWGVFLSVEFVEAASENLKAQIVFGKPWADCVLCQQKGCKRCRNSGWTGREVFNALTDDLKALSRVKGKK